MNWRFWTDTTDPAFERGLAELLETGHDDLRAAMTARHRHSKRCMRRNVNLCSTCMRTYEAVAKACQNDRVIPTGRALDLSGAMVG